MIQPYPIPDHLSPAAQAMLAMPAIRPAYPDLHDTAGWRSHIREADRSTLSVLPQGLPGMHAETRTVDGVTVYIHRSKDVAPDGPVYLDLHPGALIQLGGDACRILGGFLAVQTGLETWSVDYRVPPDHPYPAALEDALRVYARLLREREPDRVVVGGVSAGGNLAAALLLRARTEGLPMPAALYLGTPEVDLTESGDSFVVNADADNTLASLAAVNALYANGHPLTDPLLSPLFGDLTAFPPTLLTTGTRDLFLSNTVRMHRALRQVGVPAELHVFDAMPHIGFPPGSPESLDLARELRDFLGRHLPSAATDV